VRKYRASPMLTESPIYSIKPKEVSSDGDDAQITINNIHD